MNCQHPQAAGQKCVLDSTPGLSQAYARYVFSRPPTDTTGRIMRDATGLFQASGAPALPCGSFEEKQPFVNEDEPPMNTNRHED